MAFLPSYNCAHTTIWMHHVDINKMHRKKARWKLHKIVECSLEQILQACPYQTAAVWPLASNLTNHSSDMNKTCETLLEKQGQIYNQCSHMDVPVLANQQRFIYISLEDLPRTMDDRDGWRESKSGSCAVSVTWWWFI